MRDMRLTQRAEGLAKAIGTMNPRIINSVLTKGNRSLQRCCRLLHVLDINDWRG
jgi:hypothetical protein